MARQSITKRWQDKARQGKSLAFGGVARGGGWVGDGNAWERVDRAVKFGTSFQMRTLFFHCHWAFFVFVVLLLSARRNSGAHVYVCFMTNI